MDVEIRGVSLRLLPQRAALLVEAATLLVADAHLGKAASFRRLGVPVPEATTGDNLERLSALVADTGARRIVFLGDLVHSARSHAPATVEAITAWRRRQAHLELTLVRGNHDRHAGPPPAAWGLEVLDGPLPLNGLLLAHEPRPEAGGYVLAGHLHPCAVLGGRAHDRLRLPCFHFGAEVGLLPAFGSFTGMHVVPRASGDRVYVIADAEVRPLPG
jgi:DNA ligase-associated metallophosphoesterase